MINSKHNDNQIADLYKQNSRKVLATLVRLLGDFDLAEEAMHEAFTSALELWQPDNLPDNPTSWLISTGRHKAIDIIRRRRRFQALAPELIKLTEALADYNQAISQKEIEDDQLRLIFTCCHPAIDPKVQIPLILREVCGLTTEEIASAFLTSTSTMAQRIVRGKNKIRDAKIPYVIPTIHELPQRLDSVLSVIYLVFNEGYSASAGDSVIRNELTYEAIRLNRLLLTLINDAEVMGLLALMLLHESRRDARIDQNGDIILLEEQNRKLWNQSLIFEGVALVQQSLNSKQFGFYTIQAAISAVHAQSSSTADTDWNQIIALYGILLNNEPSPIIELNQAVAIAMRDGPQAGLNILNKLKHSSELANYHLLHCARGELYKRAEQPEQAKNAFEQALKLAKQAPEQRLIQKKLASLKNKSN